MRTYITNKEIILIPMLLIVGVIYDFVTIQSLLEFWFLFFYFFCLSETMWECVENMWSELKNYALIWIHITYKIAYDWIRKKTMQFTAENQFLLSLSLSVK